MINLKKENKTYITGVLEKNEDEKSEYYIPNYLSCKSAKKISQTIEHSEPKRNKKIISIVFPIINPRSKKNFQNLISSSHKYLKSNQENNNSIGEISKSYKNISIELSKLRNKRKNTYFEDNNKKINSIDNDSKNNSLSKNYCITSINEPNKLYINQVECNLNLDSSYKKENIKQINKYNNLLYNSLTSKTQRIKQRIFNKEHGESEVNNYMKKEPIIEDKRRLVPYFMKRFSPRLLRKKNTKIKREINNSTNKRNVVGDEYKIRNAIFKNQTIPYVEKIDVRKKSLKFPPIRLGSQFNLPEKSEDSIKREMFYNEIKRIENERKKRKSENKNYTKKEMLQLIKKKKLINCKYLINKTRINISETKNKIDKFYNKLKTSLNQFDDWNSPENLDNLYDS